MPSQKTRVPLKTISEVKPNSFIFEKRNALSASLCEQMIHRFEESTDEQFTGRIGQVAMQNLAVKRSTDLLISGKQQWKDIDQALFQSLACAMREFRATFPYFSGSFKDMGYGMQRTQHDEYYHWHIDGGSHDFSNRQLVAIWYLNDVSGPGGETEFLVQQICIKPEQGKLLLFPPFWTHEHRGVVLQKGVKYIATTWIVFA